VNDVDSFAQSMQQRCVADAWKTWCSTLAARNLCKTADPPPDLEIVSFSAHSDEQILLSNTPAATSWILNTFRGSPRNPPKDLLGDITVHFTGSVNINYRIPPDEKP
jgi:hypothetical protein